jgi:hypothetical protein
MILSSLTIALAVWIASSGLSEDLALRYLGTKSTGLAIDSSIKYLAWSMLLGCVGEIGIMAGRKGT